MIGGSDGKTTLLSKFLFDDTTDEGPTLEDWYYFTAEIEGSSQGIQLVDTGSAYFENHLFEKWAKDADGFIAVYSITDKFGTQNLKKLLTRLLEIRGNEITPLVICGNKSNS